MGQYMGYFIGVVGLIATIYGVMKSRRYKRYATKIRHFLVVKDYQSTIPDLEIRYAGQKIKELKVAKLGFYNIGNETINKDDIAASDPLRIELEEEGAILKLDVIAASRPAISVQVVQRSQREGLISFDFLDPRDGAVIQIYARAYIKGNSHQQKGRRYPRI